jgi:uncharacterized membrane protein
MEEQVIQSVTTTRKVDDYTIEITETKEPVVTIKEYDINFLLQQRKDIQAQKDAFDAARDRELAEVDSLLKYCEENMLVSKPIKAAPVDITPVDVLPVDISPVPVEDPTLLKK